MNDPRFMPPPVRPAHVPQPTEGPGATKRDATTVFILGILGIILCQILAPIAWVKGNTYVKCCAINEVPPDGLGVAGRIMGIVGTVLLALTLLWILFVFGMMIIAG